MKRKIQRSTSKKELWVADFETTTDENDCRVWAFGVRELYTGNFEYHNNIESFMQWCASKERPKIWFHNLKFDGEFIMNWLFKSGFRHVVKGKDFENANVIPKTFTTLISDKGMFYTLEIVWDRGKYEKVNKATFYDSLKIVNFPVEKLPKKFGLEEAKGEIDYTKYRPPGYELTKEEIDYLYHDVNIVAQVLEKMFSFNLTKITQGSSALNDFKTIFGKDNFKRTFPPPAYDKELRPAYKGGWTYLNPKYADMDLEKGLVLDVNSLYPWVMYEKMLPYGEGVPFEGQYKFDRDYPLYIQKLTCNFELKENHLPMIQLKNTLSFMPTEYLTSSNGKDVTLMLSNVDLKLFAEHYDVVPISYDGGYKFHGAYGLFKAYIDKWVSIKIEADKNGDEGMRQVAKLMLNALYGKFALNPNVCSKIPYFTDRVKYKPGDEETREPVYLPMGIFITAYAREKTIRSAQKCYDRFIYSDTDSLHLLGWDIPEGLEVDKYKLGAWKDESYFTKARFIRAKSYIEEIDGKLKITCAGLPDKCYVNVTWDNFHPGAVYVGKLSHCHVPGGVVLKPTEFTIKELL